MFKKFTFIISALFAPFVFADMHMSAGGEVNHMSDMMSDSSVEDSGFWGSVELKYTFNKPNQDSGDAASAAPTPQPAAEGETADEPVATDSATSAGNEHNASYRARVGWKGDVNETVKWGVSVSSALEGKFLSPSLRDVQLEQAYVSYSPVEGFTLKAGKYGWKAKFHKTGVLYDDDIYTEGVYAKYYYGERDSTNAYVKAIAYRLDKDWKGPFNVGGTIVAGKVGGAYEVSDGMALGAYGSLESDFVTSDNAKKLLKAGVHFNADLGVPAGAFAVYATDVDNFGFNSYTAGVYVGNAGSNCSKNSEVHDFGVAVSYYDVKEADFNTTLLDTDYATRGGGDAKGVAARAQYNLWDNANAVVKYAYNLNSTSNDPHSVVGEATFNF